ncbi:MAG: transcriptional regulator NrdR [Firmicutes bacterium]|nr:transcriptional regulator NrdR [Bacillota bacterium]
MKCIYCGSSENKVVDSRYNDGGNSIRRRRECISCAKRFTSYETVELVPILVIKRDGGRESFNPQKIKSGVTKACEKRPVSMFEIDKLVENIEKTLSSNLDQEVTSQKIGDLIMKELKSLDEIAYVRFAAVYRQFKDISTFFDFIKELEQKRANEINNKVG